MFSVQQQLIINYDFLNINSPNAVCIVAGAGSGKTTTIIEKIVQMINSGLKPNEFFITTFTRNASSQLKDKLSKYLTIEQIDQMCIGTFHSIAYHYMKKYNKSKSNVAQSFDKLLYDYLELTKTIQYQQNESHNYIFIDEYQHKIIVLWFILLLCAFTNPQFSVFSYPSLFQFPPLSGALP